MPANITEVEGRFLMAANWDRGHPWHRLGKQVARDMTIEEALEWSGSDDYVYPVPLFDAEGKAALWQIHESGEVPDIIGIKSDKYGVMGHASPGYDIMQRGDILQLAYDIVGLAKGDAHIDTIGNIGDKAEKFFAYIRVPDLVIDPHGIADTIERGLFVATSFNRTLPNTIGYSNIRVVCENTLQMALPGLAQAIRVMHRRNAEQRIRQAAEALQYVGAVDQAIAERATDMLKVDGDRALHEVLSKVWPVESDMTSNMKSRRERERGDIHMLYDGPDNTNVDRVGRNGWAAYNAVAEYLDHARTVKQDPTGWKRSEANVLPGQVANKKIQASELVLSIN